MQNMVDMLCNGAEEFTPEVIVSLIVFCIVLETIGAIAGNIIRVGRGR